MSLQNYSVFRGKIDNYHAERDDDPSPHFQLFVKGSNQIIRCAVNVRSKLSPSELAFFVDRRFKHPVTAEIETVKPGYTALDSSAGQGLDYIRSNLFDLDDVTALPADAPGSMDDLQDIALSLCRSAQEANADLFVFGEPFPDGIHDIHMNQGNASQFKRDNGIFQDGGILFYFHTEQRWAGLFLAFQSQSIHTDEEGNPLPDSLTFADIIQSTIDQTPPVVIRPIASGLKEGSVRIIAALVNPEGAENQPGEERHESVTLFNFSPVRVSLEGWHLVSKSMTISLKGREIRPNSCLQIEDNAMRLGNRGGMLTLLDASGKKMHGVSYTAEQARREGWAVRF